ncbi:C-terminal domain of homeodomain 1-domain-containing protein [Ephemerocybe angulata]|uniref:C-terminal domain of homeodomain 1-domain-containing protein n=1 Tax=Ephemerocybe angulata TaxID=980116 RepID=A0A8H6H6C9_9AGAR|nr:C-terminal domain of homeodomain 1-domain-containing protein [Tulosesus angulatus]
METFPSTEVGNTTDSSVRDHLHALRDQFLSSLSGSIGDLKAFDTNWTTFSEGLQQKLQHLTSSTLSLIYSFADTVDIVTCNLLECQVASEELRVVEDVQALLEEGFCTAITEEKQRPHAPQYIESCAEWLLHNIHNPYPTPSLRASLASRNKSPKQDVDAWFIDARKRIGWSSLRKNRFGNRKADIVKAATQFFVHDDPAHPLDALLESEFAAIQCCARDLYMRKFFVSPLASELDQAVKDLTPELKSRNSRLGRRRSSRVSTPDAAASYPTPDHSPNVTALRALSPSSSASELSIHTPAVSKSKKRRSRSQDDSEDAKPKSAKKRRILQDHKQCSTPMRTPLASPSPEPIPHAPGTSRAPSNDKSVAPSELSQQIIPSSAPLAFAGSSFESWYSELFTSNLFSADLPPVTDTTTDHSIPLEIELPTFPSPYLHDDLSPFSASNLLQQQPSWSHSEMLDPDQAPLSHLGTNWFDAPSPSNLVTQSYTNSATLITPGDFELEWSPNPSGSLASATSPPISHIPSWAITQVTDLRSHFPPLGKLAPEEAFSPEEPVLLQSACSARQNKLNQLQELERKLAAIRAEIAAY